MEKRRTSLLASTAAAALLAATLTVGAQTGSGTDMPRANPGNTQLDGADKGGTNDRGRRDRDDTKNRSQSNRDGANRAQSQGATSERGDRPSGTGQTTGQSGTAGDSRDDANRNRVQTRDRNESSERNKTDERAGERDLRNSARTGRDSDSRPTTGQDDRDSNRSRTGASDRDRSRDSAERDRGRDRMDRDRADRDRTSVSGSVSLDTRQQTRVRETIMRRAPNRVTNVNFSVSLGTTVPRSVRLAVLPPDVVQIVPRYRGYRYVVVRDEIVIVHPQTYKVVTVIGRDGGTVTGSREGPGTTVTGSRPRSERLSFSQSQRDLIRSNARVRARDAARFSVTVGERVPETIELQEFPDTLYSELPMLRTYRYVVVDDDVLLVDPDEHRIVEVID
jgi:hypothetical protein